MKVCLIRCPSPFLINEYVFPPIGLLSVGTGLKQRGHDVIIHDGPLAQIPMDCTHYGLGPTSPEYDSAMKALALIRQYNYKARVVIGGPYATLRPENCIEDGWDAVVWGDGEIITEEAMQGERAIYRGESRPLDEYPIPDRSLINLKKYECYLDGIPATTLVTSRGCPFHCAFCCKNYSHVRLASAQRCIEEIRILHEDFGYNAVMFPEDIFIVDRRRAEAVCQYLRDSGILWRCLVRADIVVKYGIDFVMMMKASGLVEVGMGIESGSPRILKIINKGESVDTIKESIRMLHWAGVRVKGFFIIGLPGEDEESIRETQDFLDEMKLDDIDAKIYQPYPGSPIWDNKERYDIDWKDQEVGTTYYKGRPREYYGTISTKSLTTDQIYKAWVHMEAKYKRFWPPTTTGKDRIEWTAESTMSTA